MKLSEDEIRHRVGTLPVLPRAVLELRAAVADPQSSVERVVAIVLGDPALTLATLRLANSPFYGVSGRVATLRDAVQILGFNTLSSAVLTAAVMSGFERGACPGFDVDGSWRHALATALCARALAEPRGLDAETAYVGGLLHDIGRLALASVCAEPFAATLARVAGGEMPLDVERELLGVDHAQVGALVATHWRLPPALVDAIGRHHDMRPEAACTLLDVVHVADNVACALGLSRSSDEVVPPLSLDSWQRIGLAGADLPRLFAEIESRMQGMESALGA